MAPWRDILEEYSALRGEVIQPEKLNESGKRQYNPQENFIKFFLSCEFAANRREK